MCFRLIWHRTFSQGISENYSKFPLSYPWVFHPNPNLCENKTKQNTCIYRFQHLTAKIMRKCGSEGFSVFFRSAQSHTPGQET